MISQSLLIDGTLNAFKRHAAAHSAAIVDMRPNPLEKPDLGSGTCIRIGDRLFVATAAHVLEDIEPANLRVIAQRRNLSTLPLTVIGRGRARQDDADVAYLAIEPDAEVEAVTVDRFERAEVLPDDVLAVVAGSTHDRLRLSGNARALAPGIVDANFTWHVQPFTYATNSLPLAEWPKDTRIQYRPASHRLLRYAPGIELDSHASVGVVELAGMSGGGIWLVPVGPADGSAGLWSPTSARLAGIQTGVLRTSGVVVGCSLRPWIDLLATDFPELRDALSIAP